MPPQSERADDADEEDEGTDAPDGGKTAFPERREPIISAGGGSSAAYAKRIKSISAACFAEGAETVSFIPFKSICHVRVKTGMESFFAISAPRSRSAAAIRVFPLILPPCFVENARFRRSRSFRRRKNVSDRHNTLYAARLPDIKNFLKTSGLLLTKRLILCIIT